MDRIKVVIHGVMGKMGHQILSSLGHNAEIEIVGAVDVDVTQNYLTESDKQIPLSSSLADIIKQTNPQVVIDFTNHEAAMTAMRTTLESNVNMVIGTTGFSADDLGEIDNLAKEKKVGVIAAPNFALGAVLMMNMAQLAAKYFDYAEIIELHHEQKIDAPSGTAVTTARAMVDARGKPFFHVVPKKEVVSNSRGGELGGVAIHSVRMPGLFAHQEVVLGSLGQTLTIRHDTGGRECYVPGILMAVKKVVTIKGLIYGLDKLLSL